MGLDASEVEDKIKMRIFITVSLVALSLFATGCAKVEAPKPKDVKGPGPAAGEAVTDTVQQKMLSFNLEGLGEKGDKKWEVKGESAEVISENEIKLNNIVAKSYGDEALATITAEKGIYDKIKNNVRLEENVEATIENIQSFARSRMGLPGQAASPNPERDDINSKKKTKTVITCEGEVQFDYEKNFACFDKNVKVTSDDGNIDADKITIHLEPGTKKINDIVAEGNVKIQRGENVTYSEKATYIEADKKVILTGSPRLVIYQDGEAKEKFLGL